MIYWFRVPELTCFSSLNARARAVVPLLRGRSPTRSVAPKPLRGLGRAFSPAFLCAWVPKNLARRKRETRAIADQSPLLKLSLRRVPFQRTSTRQQLDCAKTL